MAQGLASGQLENPRTGKKFTGRDADRAKQIAALLDIPEDVAQKADNLRMVFKQYTALPVHFQHTHAQRGWQDQTEEWLECVCKGSRRGLTEFAEENVGTPNLKVAKLLYFNLPEEADAYCIETWVEGPIVCAIDPNGWYKNVPRSSIPGTGLNLPPPRPTTPHPTKWKP